MEYEVRSGKNPFSNASMVLGILSVLTLGTIFLPLPMAALGILFACLAHRKGQKRDRSARIGLITSVAGLCISLSLIVSSLAMLPTMLRTPEYRDQLNAFSNQLYGESFDDMVEDLYGLDLDDLLENGMPQRKD